MPNYATPAELYDRYRTQPQVSIDSRSVPPGGLFFALRGTTDGHRYVTSALAGGAGTVVVDDPAFHDPDDERYLLVENTLAALQDLARSHRETFRLPVLAITGSNGKTTTKELVRDVMTSRYRTHATPGNFNNHIGLPLTILGTPADTEFLILEMGANHQGEIADLCRIGQPTHGLITNVGDAHLEGFGGRAGVRKGKGELYDWLAKNRGIAFINRDEDHLSGMSSHIPDRRKIFYFDSERPSFEVAGLETQVLAVDPVVDIEFLDRGARAAGASGAGRQRSRLQIGGRHNLQNAKTAVAVGKYFKVPGSDIAAALSAYVPTNHRSQWMQHRGLDIFFDAYNANPSSTAAALTAFAATTDPATNVVILGEMLELGAAAPAAHRAIALQAGRAAVSVLLVGPAMRAAATEFARPWFPDSDALAEWFWTRDWAGRKIFVKGSRGNRLERLLLPQSDPS